MLHDDAIHPDSSALRVAIADDHTLFRDGLRGLVTAEGMVAVGEAADGRQAVQVVVEHVPDVVLLDVQMPGPGPVELLAQVQCAAPSVKVIFLSMFDRPDLVRQLLASGAAAYLRKTVHWEVLRTTIRGAAAGMVHTQPPEGNRGGSAVPVMTRRELQLLRMLAMSLSNRQIAAELYVSESTAKRQLATIYGKLEVSNRMEALARAINDGLIDASSLR